ncbi:hypothetical protein ALI22I_14680 [Saccharothrix sp. ALI-22-I]|nr:hypothetical protein ALI22I_14680 [Saccharothrix sp. ALI-22-I]
MLVALAVDVGQVVSVGRLVSRVWGTGAKPRARATLHSYPSRLRRALAGMGGLAIVRRSGHYSLVGGAAEPVVNLQRFRHLCGRADRRLRLRKSSSNALADSFRRSVAMAARSVWSCPCRTPTRAVS